MIRAFHQPTAVPAALALVARGGTPAAGATALYTSKATRDLTLVDITRLGLGGTSVSKSRIVLGATVTMTGLCDAGDLPGMPGALLRRAARALGSRALRNVITVGGNVAHVAYWADMPVALVALDAEVEVRKARAAARWLPVAEALAARVPPWRGGLLTRVRVPVGRGTYGFGYERFARTSNDYALATVCAVARRDRDVLRDVRLVVGAISARPWRAVAAEALLEGFEPTPERLAAAAALTAEQARIAPNFRSDAGYRRKLIGVLARRALESTVTWALRED